MLNEEEFCEFLIEKLETLDEDEDCEESIRSMPKCVSYKDVGMLTMNSGVVVHLQDNSEFQLTIHQSRRARPK